MKSNRSSTKIYLEDQRGKEKWHRCGQYTAHLVKWCLCVCISLCLHLEGRLLGVILRRLHGARWAEAE